jgi:uncharacterized tellurite resistance protein B-like protein
VIGRIGRFFREYIKPSPGSESTVSEHSLRLATTALLIEMMKADAEMNEDERQLVAETVMRRFGMTPGESEELLKIAEEKINKATGYYEFTAEINKGFSYEEKVKVIENLWEIAFTDGHLDKYEEHMVRTISDLIYVEHRDFIEAKLRVKERLCR